MPSDLPGVDPSVLREWAREQWPQPKVSCGWLAGLLTNEAAERVAADMIAECGGVYKEVAGHSYGRPGGRLYSWGMTLYRRGERYEPPYIVLPDTALRNIDERCGRLLHGEQSHPVRRMVNAGFEPRRCDATVDFVGYEIDEMWEAAHRKDFAPWRRCRFHDSRLDGPGGGRTIELGSISEGGSGVRCYEKGAKNREVFPILRCEYEAHDTQAKGLVAHAFASSSLVAGLSSWMPSRLDWLEGYGANQEAGGSQARRDSRRYQWWEELLAKLPESVPFKQAESKEVDLDAKIEWWRRVPKSIRP